VSPLCLQVNAGNAFEGNGGAVVVTSGTVLFGGVTFKNNFSLVSESTMKRLFRRVGPQLSIVHGLM
jgi:hypothetical protein